MVYYINQQTYLGGPILYYVCFFNSPVGGPISLESRLIRENQHESPDSPGPRGFVSETLCSHLMSLIIQYAAKSIFTNIGDTPVMVTLVTYILAKQIA